MDYTKFEISEKTLKAKLAFNPWKGEPKINFSAKLQMLGVTRKKKDICNLRNKAYILK